MNQMLTIPKGEFLHLKGIEEDGPDLRSAVKVLDCVETGEENLGAGTVIGRPLEGDLPPYAWREHFRQVSQAGLVRQSRVNRIQFIDVGAGPKTGSEFTLNRLASALDVDLDDIVTSLR